ncbi:monocarboxylate transporter 9a [Brachyhypopomus gauderio]|uniref:monocarboxylate transporter 9a n=1 Tax=Brachyhypopomus gauderio TaxID=698409 RepID=UPI004043600B
MGPVAAGKPLDGGWGWVIVLACFLAQLLAFGSPQSVGVLYPEWLSTFQEGKGMTAWVGSMVSGVALIASPLCSVCVDSFGARPVTIFSGVMVAGGLMLSAFAPNVSFLIFSYGIVGGVGCGLVYVATLTITCQYFDKRRGLALGIVTTGTSVGGFLYATLQNELIELFGLEGCLLIVGALSLNLMACAGPMRPLNFPSYYLKQKAVLGHTDEPLYDKPTAVVIIATADPDSGATHNGPDAATKNLLITTETRTSGPEWGGASPPAMPSAVVRVIKAGMRAHTRYARQVGGFLRVRPFAALCVCIFLFSLGAFPPVLFMEDVAQSAGLSEHVAAVPLVSVVAVATGVGKLVLGALADTRGVSTLHLYALTASVSGVALLLVPASHSYAGLQALCAALGFFSGNWSLTPYITTRMVGVENLSQAHGILMCFGGFGIMLGPPVVGWLFDWTQSYDLAFYFSGSCVVLGGVTLFLATLSCWGLVEKEGNTPEMESTCEPGLKNPSDCDKVASVA